MSSRLPRPSIRQPLALLRHGAQAAWRHFSRLDSALAWGIFALSVAILLLTTGQGFVRDEGYYFRAAREYHGFFEQLWGELWGGNTVNSFSDTSLLRHFSYNTEHPGFVKLLMGFTWKIFHVSLGILSSADGFRLGAILMVAAGNSFLYLFAKRLFSRPVGVLSVFLFMLSPHVFYHSHLACFDGPIVAMTIICAYAFWRAIDDGGMLWTVAVGLVWGVALATKHNAMFLGLIFLVAYFLSRPELKKIFSFSKRGLHLPSVPVAFASMALLGPAVFYLTYPYGWHAPLSRIAAYFKFHLQHEHYPVDYLGTLYSEPPFPLHFPFVFSALTIPVLILLPGLFGLLRQLPQLLSRRIVDSSHRLGLILAILLLLYPPILIALPTVPIFGGTKHWMTMMPFVAIFAAWVWMRGFSSAYAVLHGRWFTRAVVYAVALASIGHLFAEVVRAYPLGHTYFNELVAGHQGGAALRMPRTFWGGDGRELLDELNASAPQGARVFTDRMNRYDFVAYQKDGLLRKDLRFERKVQGASWALVNHQREYRQKEFDIWARLGMRKPHAVFAIDGVRIVSLYKIAPSRAAK